MQHKLLRSILLAFFCCLQIFHANSQADAQRTPPSARIIDGTRVPAAIYPNVTPIFPGDSLCTGTLIAPRFILTAAHCFFGDNNQQVVGNTGSQVEFAGQTLTSAKVHIHPSYRSRSEACVEGEFDAALIELASDVSGIAPATLARSAAPVGLGLTIVGYGTEGTGAQGEQDSTPPSGFVNTGVTFVEGLTGTYLEWTFDNGESNTASGDSGGPSFGVINNQTALVGITCGGTGNSEFGTQSLNTRVDRIVNWIDSIAGTNPNPSAPTLVGPTTIQGRIGVALSAALSFAGSTPNSIEATGLPAGLLISGSSIVGTPQTAGTFRVAITSSNELGATSTDIVIAITSFSTKLTLKSALLQFDFTEDAEDFLILKGKISLPKKFKPKGKKFLVQVGRFKKLCKLDAKAGCGKFDFFQLNGSLNRGAFTKTSIGFELQLINLGLFEALATLGFPDSSSATVGQIIQLPIEFILNGISFSETISLKFRTSDERWAKTK